MGAPASRECADALTTLLSIFNRLGLPVAMRKLEGPGHQLAFLGFELDSSTLEIWLSPAKLSELQQLFASWVGRRSCSKKELESLVGKLGHATRAVVLRKMFMRCMFELLAGAQQAHHHVHLNALFRSGVLWWATFLGSWNRMAMMQTQGQGQPSHHVWTDASGRFRCGGVCPALQAWLQLQWPEPSSLGAVQLREESILLQELLPIVLACAVWGPNWQGSRVVVHCNNTGALAVVNTGYSKVPQIMHLLRCLFFIQAFFHLSVWAVHVPGMENGWADAISCNHLPLFFSQVPGAVGRQEPLPPALGPSCMCFFGFLRAGEVVILSSKGFDPTTHLAYGDVQVDSVVTPWYLEVTIKASKTEPFRKGVSVFLGMTSGDLCMVASILDYMVWRGQTPGPFFLYANGICLTRDWFVTAMRAALNQAGTESSLYAGHSFHIGQQRWRPTQNPQFSDQDLRPVGRVQHIWCTSGPPAKPCVWWPSHWSIQRCGRVADSYTFVRDGVVFCGMVIPVGIDLSGCIDLHVSIDGSY